MATKRLFEAEIPEGTHLDASRDSAGAFRGTLRDDDNHLVGHVELLEVDKDDTPPWDIDPAVPDSDAPGVGAALVGLALVGLTVGAVGALAGTWSDRKERRRGLEWKHAEARRAATQAALNPRVSAPADWYDVGSGRLRWWDGEQWTDHFRADRAAPRAGWYDDGSGRQRWWDGREWTEHFQDAHEQLATLSAPAVHRAATPFSSELEVAREQPRVSMSSAEWQERLRAMLLARAFSEQQWKLLSNVLIEDADGALVQWQSELRKLTPQRFSDLIVHELDTNPELRDKVADVSAGWYDDGSGRQRWWDGAQWTDQVEADKVRTPVNRGVSTPAGWYDDGSGRQRWWDGQRWTGNRA